MGYLGADGGFQALADGVGLGQIVDPQGHVRFQEAVAAGAAAHQGANLGHCRLSQHDGPRLL